MATGAIIEPTGCNVRDHERNTTRAFADRGHTVTFIPESKREGEDNPDILMDGIKWEMKSPKTDKLSQIENNIQKANHQSSNIIIDSQRVKYIPDKIIQNLLIERFKQRKTVKRLLFVNRKREIIDIAKLT